MQKSLVFAAGGALLAATLLTPFVALADTTSTPLIAPAPTAIRHAFKIKDHAVNGTLTAISGSSLTLTAGNGGTYTVDATNAKLVRKFGATMAITDFQVNDKIMVTGTITGNNVVAKNVRDMSLQAKNGMFQGSVTAINGTSLTLLTGKRGSQTINTDSSTVVKKNGQAAQFSDIVVNATVKVTGVWDRTNTNVTAKTINIIVRNVRLTVNGTLASIDGTNLTVTGNNQSTYTVDASKARLVRKFGGKSSLSEFKVGDKVQVMGTHVNQSTNIMATLVRDNSITAKTVKGIVTPTTPTTTSAQ